MEKNNVYVWTKIAYLDDIPVEGVARFNNTPEYSFMIHSNNYLKMHGMPMVRKDFNITPHRLRKLYKKAHRIEKLCKKGFKNARY